MIKWNNQSHDKWKQQLSAKEYKTSDSWSGNMIQWE